MQALDWGVFGYKLDTTAPPPSTPATSLSIFKSVLFEICKA